MTDQHDRDGLNRLVQHDLNATAQLTERGTWTTTSSLPHELRVHDQAGTPLLRMSAGALVGVEATPALLELLNDLNTGVAFCRWFVVDGKVLVTAEQPVASLREGDVEHLVSAVLCVARLYATMLAGRGGRPTTDPPPSLAPDLHASLRSWPEVLRASRTATAREFNVWLDDVADVDCWLDLEAEDQLVVAVGTRGTAVRYPFTLAELVDAAQEIEDDDEEEL